MSGKDLAKGVQDMVDIRKHANLLVVAVQEWRFVELFRSVCKETVGSTLPKLTCRIDANLNPRTYDCRVIIEALRFGQVHITCGQISVDARGWSAVEPRSVSS